MDLQNERYYFSRKKTYVAAYRSGQKERQYSRKSSSQSKTAPPPDIFLGFLKYFSSENYCCAYSLLLFCAAIWCFLRLLVFLACRCCLTTYDIEENPLSLDLLCGYDFTSNDCYIMKLFARQQQSVQCFLFLLLSHSHAFSPTLVVAGCMLSRWGRSIWRWKAPYFPTFPLATFLKRSPTFLLTVSMAGKLVFLK